MGFQAHTSDGLAYLDRAGAGPVLVCLHGIGSNGGSFAPLLERLPRDWRVIAWHAPGYLGSAPLAQDWPVAADYAAALKAFLDRLGLERVWLLGHSLGCLTAASFLRSAPEPGGGGGSGLLCLGAWGGGRLGLVGACPRPDRRSRSDGAGGLCRGARPTIGV